MGVQIQDFEIVPQAQSAPEPPPQPSPAATEPAGVMTPCDLERMLQRHLERAARVWAW